MGARDERATVEVIIKGQAANATLKEMQATARALSADLRRLPVNSEEFAKKSEQFKQVNSRLKSIQTDLKDTGGMFGWLSKEVKAFGLIAIGALGFQWFTSQVSNIIRGNAELSDSFADIRKTTGMTENEVRRLNTAFSQLDTRTSTKDLRAVAVAAGQLGVAKGDILRFTAATDKLVVSLKDEFAGGATEITTVMGKLRNVFADIKSDKIDEDMLHIGNAINQLASNGMATGPVVADFAQRIGAVGINLGMSSGQVLGLSATLQELGVNTERGGTAISKILVKMTTNVKDFAKVAGMDTQKFAELINKDLFGAFMKVVEGSQKGGTSATAFAGILDQLGTEGAGTSEVMSKLSKNTAMVHEKIDLATTSLKGTDSIMNEFNLKNRTLGAEMDRLGKNMNSMFTNSTMSSALKGMIGWLADITDHTKKVSEAMADEQNTVNGLVIELKSANTTNERRKEIYEELNAINPAIVEGINKENINIAKLTENLVKYNEQQVIKIALQKQQEKIDKANEDAAEKLTELADKQRVAYEVLGMIQRKNGPIAEKAKNIAEDESLSVLEKIRNISKLVAVEEWRNGVRNKEATQIKDLIMATRGLNMSEAEYQEAISLSADLTHKKLQMEKQFGAAEEQRLDYSKKTEKELHEIIHDNFLSRGFMAKEAAAAQEELKRRVNETAKNTKWVDPDALKEAEKKAKQHAKEVEKIYKDLLKDVAGIAYETSTLNLAELEKEFEKIIHERNIMLDRINSDERLKQKVHAEEKARMISEVEKNANVKIELLGKKNADEVAKATEEAIKRRKHLVQSAIENDLTDTAEKYDKEINEMKKVGEDTTQLEEAKQKALAAIKKKYSDKEEQDRDKLREEIFRATRSNYEMQLAETRKHYDDLIAAAREAGFSVVELERAKAEKIKAINDAAAGEAIQKFLDQNEEYMAGAKQLGGNYQNYVRQKTKDEFNLYEEKYNEEKERDKRLYDNKVISKETYDARVQQLDANFKNRQRMEAAKAHQKEKEAAIFSAIINGVEAVTRIWAKHAGNPIVAGILTGIAVANTAIQVATIRSAPVPKYATGGYHKQPEGYTQGASMYGSSTGQPFVAGEAGKEYIVSNALLQNPWVGRWVEMTEAIRTGRSYAQGGYNAQSGGKSQSSGGGMDIEKFCAAANMFADAVSRLEVNGIEAYIDYDSFNKTLRSIDEAKNGSAVR